jgi:hypothetical protein
MKEYEDSLNCTVLFPNCPCHTCKHNLAARGRTCCYKMDKDCFNSHCRFFERIERELPMGAMDE